MNAPSDTAIQRLISDDYRQLNCQLHREDATFGTTGRRYVKAIRQLARKHKASHILDYGCGKQDLAQALKTEFEVRSFDPAIVGLDSPPQPADVVACIDVLEHVEPEYLELVLTDLARLTIVVAFLAIATGPSGKRLADGSNCHRIVSNPEWWLRRLDAHFRRLQVDISANCVQLVAEPNRRAASRTP